MTRTLVTYASKHGSTEEVARTVAARLRDTGQDVDVRDAAIVDDLEPYDAVVVGGSLYMGRWHGDARSFVRRHRAALEERPLAIFALGPRSLAEDEVAGSRKQLTGALTSLGVHPHFIAIFGGVVDPTKLHFPLNRMPATDARDWNAIRGWSDKVAARFADYLHAAPVHH